MGRGGGLTDPPAAPWAHAGGARTTGSRATRRLDHLESPPEGRRPARRRPPEAHDPETSGFAIRAGEGRAPHNPEVTDTVATQRLLGPPSARRPTVTHDGVPTEAQGSEASGSAIRAGEGRAPHNPEVTDTVATQRLLGPPSARRPTVTRDGVPTEAHDPETSGFAIRAGEGRAPQNPEVTDTVASSRTWRGSRAAVSGPDPHPRGSRPR